MVILVQNQEKAKGLLETGRAPALGRASASAAWRAARGAALRSSAVAFCATQDSRAAINVEADTQRVFVSVIGFPFLEPPTGRALHRA